MSAVQDSAVERLTEALDDAERFDSTGCMVKCADLRAAITAWNTRSDTTLREQRDELLEALEDVRSRIAASDEWWMECHDRGGFDIDQIDASIAKART